MKKTSKKLFTLSVSWQMCAQMQIEAQSREEAIKIAEVSTLPENGVYLDDSFHVYDEDEV